MRFTKRTRPVIKLLAAALGSVLVLFATGCQKKQSAPANQPAPQTQTASPPPKAAPRTYHGEGVVTKIVLENPYDKSLTSVELNHGEIVGLMPAMQMEFYVKEKSLLNGIKVGDKVDFTLEATESAEIVSEIKKR